MQEISLSPSLSQKVYVTLGGQNCAIKLHQRSTGFYIDLYVDDTAIMQVFSALTVYTLSDISILDLMAISFL
jgi:hypothetical protein